MFKIVQKIDMDWIEDEILDCDTVTVGYVEDEFFAQEFCSKHPCCEYEPVIPIKYPLHLEANMIWDKEDMGLLKIPYKKAEWEYDE